MNKILITGGTGQLGQMFLKQISNEDLHTDVLTRNKILDSTTNIGYLNADLTKIETLTVLRTDYDIVVHCASNPKDSDSIDIEGTKNLLKTIYGSNIKNFLYISIVGVDKTMFKYYQNKLKVEELIVESGIPYTILRITQFHDFVYDRILTPGLSDTKNFKVPAGLKFQSIDLIDVCKVIKESMETEPTNSISQIGGPDILNIIDIVDAYQDVFMPNREIPMISPNNDFQKLFTTGINLCPNHKRGKITWKDFLLKKFKENKKD